MCAEGESEQLLEREASCRPQPTCALVYSGAGLFGLFWGRSILGL